MTQTNGIPGDDSDTAGWTGVYAVSTPHRRPPVDRLSNQ